MATAASRRRRSHLIVGSVAGYVQLLPAPLTTCVNRPGHLPRALRRGRDVVFFRCGAVSTCRVVVLICRQAPDRVTCLAPPRHVLRRHRPSMGRRGAAAGHMGRFGTPPRRLGRVPINETSDPILLGSLRAAAAWANG